MELLGSQKRTFVAMQGFCCSCATGDEFNNGEQTRAGMLCNWQDHPSIPYCATMPVSAHCLRVDPGTTLDNDFWELTTILPKETIFELDVTVDTTLATAATDAVSVLTISESQPSKKTLDLPVWVEIQNYETSHTFPEFSTTHRALVKQRYGHLSDLNKDDVLFLDKSLVSDDGTECNKVGTWFPAFKCEPPRPSHDVCLFHAVQSLKHSCFPGAMLLAHA